MSTGRRRWILWTFGGLALVAVLALAFRPQPVPVDLGETTCGLLEVTLDEEGQTRVRDRFVISAPVAGRVQRIELEPGDPVVAGETILAVFQPSQPALLDARARREAQAEVRAAEARLEQSRADRERRRAEQAFALSERERFAKLAADGVVSSEQMDTVDLDAERARKNLSAAESAVRTVASELQRAQARLVETGGATSGDDGRVDIVSPVDGVVLRRLRESESVVPAGEPLLEIGDPSMLEIVVDYLSTDAVKIEPGDPVRIERWGGDRMLLGRVRRVEPFGFTKVSALGVEEQRVNVVIDFDDPRDAWRSLGDGYRVETRVVIWSGEDVTRAPSSSLFRSGEDWAVFVVHEGRAARRSVVVGQRNTSHVEVLEGLEPGAVVVRHPADDVVDGVRVRQREVR